MAPQPSDPRRRFTRRRRDASERPRTAVELLYEVLQSLERRPEIAEKIHRGVVRPLLTVLTCLTMITAVVGAVVLSFVLQGKRLDLGTLMGSVRAEWLVGGTAGATLTVALVRRLVRRNPSPEDPPVDPAANRTGRSRAANRVRSRQRTRRSEPPALPAEPTARSARRRRRGAGQVPTQPQRQQEPTGRRRTQRRTPGT